MAGRPTAVYMREIQEDIMMLKLFNVWDVQSLLCFRTSHLDNLSGLIVLHAVNEHVWTLDEIELLEYVGAQVATGLAQSHLLELEKACEVAEKANNAKSEWLAIVSHEVR